VFVVVLLAVKPNPFPNESVAVQTPFFIVVTSTVTPNALRVRVVSKPLKD
jgi:hypothetical protein